MSNGPRVGNAHNHVYVIRFEGPNGLIYGAYNNAHITMTRLRVTASRGMLFLPNYKLI